MSNLPPDPLPPLDDPLFDGPSPYSVSDLKDVCGTKINPDAIGHYKRRSVITDPNCPVKTCAHPELEAWLGDVRSFDPHASVVQKPMSEWPMSAICPRVANLGSNGTAFALEPATYVIDYASLHSNMHTLPERPWLYTLRDLFPEGSNLILSFFSDRALVVGLWSLTDFWYQEWLDQFDAIIAPDFSSFSDDPRPQSFMGERMQQIFAEEGSAAGHTVIPSIAWGSEDSLRRQIDLWSSRAPKVHTINLNCYGSNINKTGWAWRWIFAMEKYCQEKPFINWMVAGITVGWAIRELNRVFPEKNYTILTNLSTFIAPLRGSTDREWQAQEFRRRIKILEDYYTGENVADLQPRPDKWPMFSDLKRADDD